MVYLQAVLHSASQALLIPVMIVLAILIVYALFCIGSVVVEFFTERRHFRASMPTVINAVHDADYTQVNEVIARADLLRPQKAALTMVASNMGLPDDDLFALAKTEIAKLEDSYQGRVGRNDLVTKIAPMMGLMATLIPLGPGIVAMGNADVETLSQSLGIAFDGTVAGLLAAVVAMTVSKVRKRWYAAYSSSMEALMTCLMEKAAQARREGVELPHGYVGAGRGGAAKPQVPGASAGAGTGAMPAPTGESVVPQTPGSVDEKAGA